MNKRNYQKELEQLISNIEPGRVPTLLLHACCAPCSSYCLEYLSQYFSITVLFYNPNISPEAEYTKRVDEIRRLIDELPTKNKVSLIEGRYLPEEFYSSVKGLENEPEGGKDVLSVMNCVYARLLSQQRNLNLTILRQP